MATNRDRDRAFLVVNIVLIVVGLAYLLLQFGFGDALTVVDDSALSLISTLIFIAWLAIIMLWIVMVGQRQKQRRARRRIKGIARRKSRSPLWPREPAVADVWSTVQSSTQQQFPYSDGISILLQPTDEVLHQNSIHADLVSNSKLGTNAMLFLSEPPTGWTLLLLQRLEWLRFEEICSEFFESIPLQATSLSTGPGEAISMRLTQPDSKSTYALAKIVAGDTVVDIEPIRALYAAMTQQRILRGFCVTAGTFTTQARAAARGVGLFVIDGATLFEKIISLPQERQNALLELALEGDYMTPSCPLCRQKMVLRESGFTSLWRCSSYPSCKAHMRLNVNKLP